MRSTSPICRSTCTTRRRVPIPSRSNSLPMSVVERRHAAGVLAAMNGNKVQAARILGIHRATLARLLQEEGPAASAHDEVDDAGVLPRSHHVG